MKLLFKIIALSLMPLFIIATMFPDLLLLPITLLFGWINALRRIVSTMVPSPGALAWACLAVALIVAGTHWFGLWLWRRLGPEAVAGDENRKTPRWRWRWTLTFHAALAAVLFSAMAVVGVAHQTGWLIASREPIYVPKMRHLGDLAEMRSLAGAIEHTGAEQQWDTAAVRKLVWGCFQEGYDIRERVHAVFIEGTNGRLARALVFPRNPGTFAKTGIGIVELDAPYRTEPAAALTNLLRLHTSAPQTAAITP